MNVLKVEGISRREGGVYVLEGVSFIQARSQKIAVAGATGSGKTTLMKIIAGLTAVTAGAVFFEEKKVTGPMEQLIPGFPGIAYLSQHFELRNNYRVEEILEYANTRLSDSDAATLYEVCRITHLLGRKTDQLSGGERQRIALARLLTTSPRLLLLDEPYSNLDPGHKNNLKTVVREIGEKLGITCILVSHDPLDTLAWADEILVLRDGRLVQKDTPSVIYRQPVDEYVAGLFGSYTMITSEQAAVLGIAPGIYRPEWFRITDGAAGEVLRVEFVGRGYEVEVLLSGSSILVSMMSGQYRKGDIVGLSIDYDHYQP